MRPGAWLAFAVAAALAAAGCNGEGPNFDSAYPVGSCVILTGTADAGWGIKAADCSKAHTHVVIALYGPGPTCPPGTDVVVDGPVPGGVRCFRADASPRPTP